MQLCCCHDYTTYMSSSSACTTAKHLRSISSYNRHNTAAIPLQVQRSDIGLTGHRTQFRFRQLLGYDAAPLQITASSSPTSSESVPVASAMCVVYAPTSRTEQSATFHDCAIAIPPSFQASIRPSCRVPFTCTSPTDIRSVTAGANEASPAVHRLNGNTLSWLPKIDASSSALHHNSPGFSLFLEPAPRLV